ncbi:MAG: hypothetical protein AAFR96_03995 [Planctomycetota bacterium]
MPTTQRPNRSPLLRATLACCSLSPAMLLANAAGAQSVLVERWTGSQWAFVPGFGGATGLPNGSDVDLALTQSEIIRVRSSSGDQGEIGLITVRMPDATTPATVLVGRSAPPTTRTDVPAGQPAARSIGGLVSNGNVIAQINAGSIVGPGVDVRRLVRLDLTGDLAAPVIHRGTAGSITDRIAAIDIAGSITPAGSIVSLNGTIGEISVSGDALGTIASQNGGIETIDIAGSLGDASSPATVYGWAGDALRGILTLEVGGTIGDPGTLSRVLTGGPIIRIEAEEIHADVDALLDPADPGFAGGVIARTGDMTGSLMIRSLSSFGGWSEAPCLISAAGAFDGTLVIENVVRNERAAGPEVVFGSVAPDSLLSIRSLFASRSDLPAPEIRVRNAQSIGGQIIVGSPNEASFAGDAAVTMGQPTQFSVTPDTKDYIDLFSDLGGGAVAIAPFNFHTLESFPQHDEVILLDPSSTLTGAVVRMFGPVFGELPAVTVEQRLPGASAWIDRSADFVASAAASEIDATREVRIEAVTAAGFTEGEWRIKPVDGTIRSAFAAETPDVRFDSQYDDDTYRFSVVIDCPSDPRPITAGRDTVNDLRPLDVGDYITPVQPGTPPLCP